MKLNPQIKIAKGLTAEQLFLNIFAPQLIFIIEGVTLINRFNEFETRKSIISITKASARNTKKQDPPSKKKGHLLRQFQVFVLRQLPTKK